MLNKHNTTPNRRERKKEKTRLKIIKVAMELFFRQGFDATTMEQIAEKVDIAKGTLYNYFPVKEAIISEYWQNSIRDHKPLIYSMIEPLPDTRSRLLLILEKASQGFKSHPEISRIYVRYRLQNSVYPELNLKLRSGFEEILATAIRKGQEAGEIRKDMPAPYLALHLENMFVLLCMIWLAVPKTFPLTEKIKETIDLFLNGALVPSKKTKIARQGL